MMSAQRERTWKLEQQITVVTRKVSGSRRARNIYTDGFGWIPVLENDEMVS